MFGGSQVQKPYTAHASMNGFLIFDPGIIVQAVYKRLCKYKIHTAWTHQASAGREKSDG